MKFNYEAIWRKNYEAVSAASFAASSAGAMVLSQSDMLPAAPYYAMSALCAVMAAFRGYQARQHVVNASALHAKTDMQIITEAELKEHCSNETFWLGHGFVWGQQHVQRAYEIMKRGKFTEIERLSNERGAAWIHAIEPRKDEVNFRWKDAEGHTLIAGTTGSGKTRTYDLLLFEMGQRQKNGKYCPIIVIDPKGDKEILSICMRIGELRGNPDNVYVFHPAFPQWSCRMNPLRTFGRTTEVASRIRALLMTQAGDPFSAVQWETVDTIVNAILITERTPSIALIRRYVIQGTTGLLIQCIESYMEKTFTSEADARDAKDVILGARPQDGNPSRHAKDLVKGLKNFAAKRNFEVDQSIDALINLFEHDVEHLAKMISSLKPVLSQLTAGDLKKLISADPADIDDPRPFLDMTRAIDTGAVIYIGLDSLSDATVSSAIGSIVLAELASIAGARYNYKDKIKDMPDIYMLVDELAEVVNAPLIQLLNKGRGAGFVIFLATQCVFADLAERLGNKDAAVKVLGNCNNVIALRLKDPDSQKFVTENLVKTVVNSITMTRTSSSGGNLDPTQFNTGVSERQAETEAELFPPSLLGKLPDLEYIASVAGGKLVKGRLKRLVLERRPEIHEQPWIKRKLVQAA